MNGRLLRVVATLIVAMLGWLIADQRSLRSYVGSEISAVRDDIAGLRERMARLERLFEGHSSRGEAQFSRCFIRT